MSYICGLEGKWPDVHVMQIAAVGTCDDKRQTICLNLGINLLTHATRLFIKIFLPVYLKKYNPKKLKFHSKL